MSNRVQPDVNVGIMHSKEIDFNLIVPCYIKDSKSNDINHKFRTSIGDQTVRFVNGRIEWEGDLYDELCFIPYSNIELEKNGDFEPVADEISDENGVFWLKNVTIGVNFHWERKENQKFGGYLKFIVENDEITAINVIGVEDYLTSVISSEMSATASPELLKAHAVISRSWLLAQIQKNKDIVDTKESYSACTQTDDELIKWYDREDHINFDVCADDHCQRYQGLTRASTKKVAEAIDVTWGELLMSDNRICDARFSKCCGGVVEEFQYCWEDVKYPYLRALRDTPDESNFPDLKVESNASGWILSNPESFCNTTDKHILSQVLNNYDQETTHFYRWQEEYSQADLAALILERSGIDYGAIVDLIPIERGTSGRLTKLKIVGTKRTYTIGKELEIRRTLSKSHLYSSAFIVEKVGEMDLCGVKLPEKFIIKGAGWGHGVGLCQIGAAVMGEKGYGYKEILEHYFPGASIDKRY